MNHQYFVSHANSHIRKYECIIKIYQVGLGDCVNLIISILENISILQHKYNLLHFFSSLCIYYLDCDSFGMTFALKLSTSFFANLDLLEAEINYLTNHVNNKHTDHGMPAKRMFFKQECKIGCHKARIGW